MKISKAFLYSCRRFLIPIFLWLFVFRDFLFHKNTVNLDTILTYSVFKFFVNNLLNGVFPLWDPFVYLGVPFYSVAILGLFNPLVYVSALLIKLGLDYYTGFLIYLLGNYFAGCLGFYFLSKEVLKDKLLAYCAYIVLMFSGLGAMALVQSNLLLIFVPSVWFFYFLIRFFRHFKVITLLGMTFSSMMILTSYLPFHFLTLLFTAALLFACFYSRRIIDLSKQLVLFCKQNRWMVLLCVLSISVSAVPLYLQKAEETSSNLVHPARHCIDKSAEDCYRDTMTGKISLNYNEVVKYGGLGERVSFKMLFSHLDKTSFGSESFFYIPTIVFLGFLLSLWMKLDRRSIYFLSVGLIIYLIALGEGTPVHKFLFDHVFFVKYFRNLFFFMAYLIPMLILFVFLQLDRMFDQYIPDGKRRGLIFVTILHFGFIFFLLRLDEIVLSTYVTVILSYFICLFYVLGLLKRTSLVKYILPLLALIQPVQVLAYYNENAAVYRCELPKDHVKPQFNLTRPESNASVNCLADQFIPYIDEFWYDMLLSDASGKINFPGTVGRDIFMANEHIHENVWLKYVSTKFYLYDHVGEFNESDDGSAALEVLMKEKLNIALVTSPTKELRAAFADQTFKSDSKALEILGSSEEFRVDHFDMNSLNLETNFKDDKFLVYTDSFHSAWTVWINDAKCKIYKANAAFKGIHLPWEKNRIKFQYMPAGGSILYFLLAIYTQGFLIFTLVYGYKKREVV